MARSRIRVKMVPGAVSELMRSDAALALVKAPAEATAEACNAESSWGGYYFAAKADGDRARATVWSADNRNDEARDQRLVRNLGGA